MFDWLITNGDLIDGTGAPARRADMAISGEVIAAIGDLRDAQATRVIDATGYIVCPGFIDMHSHADLTLLANRWTEHRLRQGITTEVVGQDGLSYAPACATHLDEWRRYLVGLNGDFPEIEWNWHSVGELLQRYHRRAANVVYLIPHGAVRVEVMGWDGRPARVDELRAMVDLVQQGMAEGAAGISTGLTYAPCAHATTEELVALCKPVARAGGIFAPHLRSYGAQLLAALDEAIEIGRRSGVAVHVAHLRVADPSNLGLSYQILEHIDRARREGVEVTFDCYPYTVGCAPLFALLPLWAQSGGPDAILARLRDQATTERVADEMNTWRVNWSWYTLSNAPKTALGDWDGALLTDAALATKMSIPMFIQRLLLETELNATIIARGGNVADNDRMFRHPAAMLCSDGVMVGGHPHPRGYGTFPHFIADYVREHRIVSLPEAIHKMTGLPAQRLRLQNRGILAEGAAADIVIFSLERIAAGATFENARALPRGIDWVFINGHAVVADGAFIGGNAGIAPAR